MITTIHFMHEILAPPPDGNAEGPPYMQLRIACMPNMTEFHQTMYHPNYQRTNDVRAATCPACIKSVGFKEAKRALDEALKGAVRA